MKKIKESSIMIVQTAAILVAFILPLLIDVPKVFEQYLTENYPTPDNFLVYLSLSHGDVILSVVISVLVYWKIRKSNSSMLMSLGATPEIRDACPIVSGFIFASFCLASVES